jgi:hypothetical protein
MDSEPKPPARDGELEGRYANYFEIGFNRFEFLIDCGQRYEGAGPGSRRTRIVMSPANAKELLELLRRSMVSYEEEFGSPGGE